ncbi:hypothetical protein [Flavobacterium xanthum]|uniref:Lipoprotein n=1 Tax=Flavobacterium xanthum TaxID=69322 RepID=A0A1M7L969_9FLAO|nr:hypothetical protein [Flavobacterium xanthum]SHM74406.1 hypothetical protein SAMN05443669_10652 [Flavobacterium xanthum]
MKNNFLLLILYFFAACQSTKIKNDYYKVAPSSPELGSIGDSKSILDLQNDFNTKTLAILEKNIRLSIEVLPFNNRLNALYNAKSKYNQNQPSINYIDSLPQKPELAVIRLLDVSGYVGELNSDYNALTLRLLQNNTKLKIITSIVSHLTDEEITKIKQADSYYLKNALDKKYTIQLYKSGKKTDLLAIDPTTTIAYRTSSFCWSTTDRGKWYIADLTEGNENCKGITKSKIKDKTRTKKLFDL